MEFSARNPEEWPQRLIPQAWQQGERLVNSEQTFQNKQRRTLINDWRHQLSQNDDNNNDNDNNNNNNNEIPIKCEPLALPELGALYRKKG